MTLYGYNGNISLNDIRVLVGLVEYIWSATLLAGIFLFLIRWLNSLLQKGAKRPLQAEDLYGILEEEQTDTVTEALERYISQVYLFLKVNRELLQ